MTQTQNNNVPKLRFPEFEDDWKETTIDGLGKVVTGSTPDTSVNNYYGGDVPFFSPSDVPEGGGLILSAEKTLTAEGFAKTRKIPSGSTLFVCIGSTIGKVGITHEECAANQQINAVVPDPENDPQFVHLALVKAAPKVRELTAVQAVPIINKSTFQKKMLRRPTLPEQRKIAGFLSAVDTKIGQLNKKRRLLEDYRKGCLQQLFSQKIRFNDEDGNDFPDWEEKLLGEVVVLSAGTSKSKYISASGDRFVVDMGSVTSSGQLVCTKRTQFDGDLLDVGDLVMPKDDIGGGNIIGKVGLIDKSETYVLGDHVYRLQVARQNSMFLAYLINSHSINKSLRRKANGTAQLGLARASVLKQLVLLPHPDEQRKIADFLSALDRKIDLVGQELTHARTFKQGLLQQMFV